jgi:hypothetical protein
MNDSMPISESSDKQNERKVRLRHFAAGNLRWLLSSTSAQNWHDQFIEHCQNLVEETLQIDNFPTETDQKTIAVAKAVPGVALFWLGIYTGTFWLVPGVALGVFSSYVIAHCVNQIFSSGKEARFFRTLIYYLLRMENADGIISQAELSSLRSMIEFIPASAQEKELWLKATHTPEGYRDLAPDGSLSDEEKEKVLSACWSLAHCDGLADLEKQMYQTIGKELEVSDTRLNEIAQKVEKLFSEHEHTIWQTIRAGKTLNPQLTDFDNDLYEIVALVSLKPLDRKLFKHELERFEKKVAALPNDAFIERDRIIIAAYLLARIFSSTETDNSMAIRETFQQLTDETNYSSKLEPLINCINSSLKLF